MESEPLSFLIPIQELKAYNSTDTEATLVKILKTTRLPNISDKEYYHINHCSESPMGYVITIYIKDK
jgi:hypothetical protein